jgi:hypothetical protein
MPRQLIYTSAPRGLTPGQSGYCAVARSRDLREALIPRLEKLSYYTPEPNSGPVVCAHRVVDLRGSKFHILTRIVDAGHDFTKRRSFLAHHLIFDATEIAAAASPAELFLKWNGWIERWESDPRWIEEDSIFPESKTGATSVAKCDVWVSGNERGRMNFLMSLVERGANWDVTFTNCFQPGDNPDDFDIKAAWPNTAGYEAAKRLGASFISLANLPRLSEPHPILQPELVAHPHPVSESVSVSPPQHSRGLKSILPVAVVALTVMAFLSAIYLRHRPPTREASPLSPVSTAQVQRADQTGELGVVLPNRPTWLAIQNAHSSIPPLETLMQELRGSEVFTKDLTATIQTNLHTPAIPAALFAAPENNLLRFVVTNVPWIELTVAKDSVVETAWKDSVAIEIPGRFRLLAIKAPVELSRSYLRFGTNIELRGDLEERIHQLELPTGAQFALRPLVAAKGAWVDPLARAAHDLSIIPSTILDLTAVDAHARKIAAEKEFAFSALQEEESKLASEQQKLLTDPQTPEQAKARERLTALRAKIPKTKQELESLRARTAAIPSDVSRVERFALFLCLSNVNTEVFRFVEKP